jgi:proline racemase
VRFSQVISTVDTHTAGEPTRIVVSGIPKIRGRTMGEKIEYLRNEFDFIRTAIMREPRGHNDMFGAIITEPTTPDADLGVIFTHCGGYLTGCGHGSIGVATAAVELGWVKAAEPLTTVLLDTPSGLVKANVHVQNGRVKGVTIRNVPSFLYKPDVQLSVPSLGDVKLDISFGGNFFALVDANQLGIKVDSANTERLIDMGIKIKNAVNEKVKVIHPLLEYINTVGLVELYGESTHPEAHSKNIAVFGVGQADRSPCGTGTSARMAELHAKGKLRLNEEFVYESIVGTIFWGRLIEETRVGSFQAVVPEITGNAYITGLNQLVLDPDDPLKHGFLLKASSR